jgi:RNA polymerase sigma factor (sigma-70 family)
MRDASIVKDDPDDLEDPELIRRVASGDANAARVIYERYAPRVYRYLSKKIKERRDVEEIVNDVMMVVCQRASSLNGTSKLSTWILGIAHYKALDAPSVIGPFDEEEKLPEPVDPRDPYTFVSEAELAQRIRQAVSELPLLLREVIELTYFHDQSVEETAEMLSRPVNTVKSRMFRARKQLAPLLWKYRVRGVDDVKS